MRYTIAIVFCFFILKASFTYAQTTCYTPQEQSYYASDDYFYFFHYGLSDFGQPIPSGRTDYQFVAATPNAGQYTIVHSTKNMHPDTWWDVKTVTADIDPQHYMMVMNASTAPTDHFYQMRLGFFCPKTTYEISLYVLNLYKTNTGIAPNLTFTITTVGGAPRAVYRTGDIPGGNPAWVRHGIVFTTPDAREELVMTITNNAAGGEGNVFAMDNFAIKAYQPDIHAVINENNDSKIEVCGGVERSFTMHADLMNNYAHPVYQWQVQYGRAAYIDIADANTASYTVNYAPTEIGSISYRLSVAEGDNINCSECRAYSPALTITINALPTASSFNDVAVCEGQPLSVNTSTGDLPGQTYEWSGPNGFTSTLPNPVIPVATLADAGTYHVVVKNAALCSVSADIKVTVNPKVVASISGNTAICQGSSTVLQAGGGTSYTWLPADGLSNPNIANPVASPESATTYTVTVSNQYGCSDNATVKVDVIKPPLVNAGKDATITSGEKLKLDGSVTGDNITYYWTPTDYLSNPNNLQPTATPIQDMTYTLHVRSNSNCAFEATDDVFVHVLKKVDIPNTFSPNNDAINDTWNITSLNSYPGSVVMVFNRYGGMVFQSNDHSKPWNGNVNGKPLPEGTYYYKIDLKNGKVLSGWVAIIR